MPTLDLIQNDLLDLTKNNEDLINFCISIDSSYRYSSNINYPGSAANLISKYNFNQPNQNAMTNIIKAIDKANSTHLAVSGKQKGSNQGIQFVTNKIMSISNLQQRLEKSDPDLVNEISLSVPGYCKFSFASKFCTYMCRYNPILSTNYRDNFSIYDKVLCNILPYYAYRFSGLTGLKTGKNSNIDKLCANATNPDYAKYQGIIDNIRTTLKFKLSRESFDKMLWYYYKGDDNLIKKALSRIP